MPTTITPLPGKLASISIGGTAYLFSQWSLKFTLATGEVYHFDAQTDGNGNYWPDVFTNFATGTASASGAVDDNFNLIPISPGLYIGSTGTAAFNHANGNGFTAPVVIKDNDQSSNAAGQEPAQRGIEMVLTGPPTRVFF